MFKEKQTSSPEPQESVQAANDALYFTDVLASLSNEQLQDKRKALIWLTKETNGQSKSQRAQYQAELDLINNILAQ